MTDVGDPVRTLASIEKASRRFDKGGRVPNATRQLLVELADALAASGPLELGSRPGVAAGGEPGETRGRTPGGRTCRCPGSSGDRGLRAARRTFRLATWSARWRRRFGESRRALRTQFALVGVLAAIVGALLESAFQPGGFRPIFLVVGPVVLGAVWQISFADTAARLRFG